MPRLTKEQKTAAVAKRMKQLREARFIVSAGKCPDCGTKIYRNMSMTGWYQCGHYGAVGFQKEAGPHCSWQIFYDPTPDQHSQLILEVSVTLTDDRGNKHEAYFDSKGVIRWISNNAVPFADMLEFNHFDPHVLNLCQQVREDETFQILKAYRKQSRKPSAEEVSEMQAAFGPDVKEVVNVITGRRTKL